MAIRPGLQFVNDRDFGCDRPPSHGRHRERTVLGLFEQSIDERFRSISLAADKLECAEDNNDAAGGMRAH